MNELGLAITALRSGDQDTAYSLLRDILLRDSQNALAWLWLSEAAPAAAQQQDALRRFLALAPDHPHAGGVRRRLHDLEQQAEALINNFPAPDVDSTLITEALDLGEPFFRADDELILTELPDLTEPRLFADDDPLLTDIPDLTEPPFLADDDPLLTNTPDLTEPPFLADDPPLTNTPGLPESFYDSPFTAPPSEDATDIHAPTVTMPPEFWMVVAVGVVVLYFIFDRRR